MPIVPIMKPAAGVSSDAEAAANVQAWAEQASAALQSVSLSSNNPRNASLVISPEVPRHDNVRPQSLTPGQVHITYGKSTLIRRDSLDRREALLKGKEGSRQRRRWENDRLLSNPWAQPPLPSDWEVQPTYPRRAVPYYLAPLWDAAEFQRSIEEKMKGKAKHKNSRHGRGGVSPAEDAASNVPKEVRAKLKRARAAKGLLQDLEEQVRLFLQKWAEKEEQRVEDGLHDVDSEEEEIVFVGRNGVMHDSPGRTESYRQELRREKMLFEGMADDRGASFGRWLVHSIGTYYGLQTWSVTTGDPARREAYVGLGEKRLVFAVANNIELPRPLWGMV